MPISLSLSSEKNDDGTWTTKIYGDVLQLDNGMSRDLKNAIEDMQKGIFNFCTIRLPECTWFQASIDIGETS